MSYENFKRLRTGKIKKLSGSNLGFYFQLDPTTLSLINWLKLNDYNVSAVLRQAAKEFVTDMKKEEE
jgi:hypothetical protein